MLTHEYLAGLFDGEGCIQIRKDKTNGPFPSYCVIAQITMTNERVIHAVKESCDGRYHKITWQCRNNNRPAYMWNLHAQKAADFLTALLPFLIVKKEEAAYAIAFQKHIQEFKNKFRGMPDDQKMAIRVYRENCHKTLQAMKRISGALDGMVANSEDTQNGQPRAKQQAIGMPVGMCNEQVPPSKEKICSELGRNVESAAEMTAPGVKH